MEDSRRVRPYLLGGLIGVLAAAAVGFGLLYFLDSDEEGSDTTTEEQVVVPTMRGVDADTAAARIGQLGLSVEIVTEPAPDRYRDAVVEQSPEGGTEVAAGSSVQLVTGE